MLRLRSECDRTEEHDKQKCDQRNVVQVCVQHPLSATEEQAGTVTAYLNNTKTTK